MLFIRIQRTRKANFCILFLEIASGTWMTCYPDTHIQYKLVFVVPTSELLTYEPYSCGLLYFTICIHLYHLGTYITNINSNSSFYGKQMVSIGTVIKM